jgi:hypothetical protein
VMMGCDECCSESDPCIICADNFDRADSTDIDTGSECGWSEDAGNPTITSNVLRVSSANAVIISTTQQPDGDPDVYLTVSVRSSASGDKIRLIGDYLDASNYHYLEVTIGVSGSMAIGKRTAGVDATLASGSVSAPANTWLSMDLCINATRISSIAGGLLLSSATTASNPEFGLGTGGTVTGNVEFDDFTAEVSGADCSACFALCEECIDGKSPLQIKLVVPAGTFSNLSCTLPQCQSLEGTFFLPRVTSCVWLLCLDTIGGGCCVANAVRFSFIGGVMRIDFGNVSGEGGCSCCTVSCDAHSFRLAYAGDQDCMNFEDLQLPWTGSTLFRCTSSAGKYVEISAA